MLRRKKIYISMLFGGLIFLLLGACTQDDESSWEKNGYRRVKIIIEDLPLIGDTDVFDEELDQGTRFSLISGYSTFNRKYTIADTLGIFPEFGYQIPFPMPIAPGASKTGTVDNIEAFGWMTKDSTGYAVYMPFNFYNRKYNRIPWDYRKKQLQLTNNGYVHLAERVFIGTADTIPGDSGVFHAMLQHMGVFLRVRLKTPVAATWTKLVMVAQNNAFTTYGYYDLFDKANGYPYIPANAGATSNYFPLYIDNLYLAAAKTMAALMVLPPVDLEGQTLTFYIYDDTGSCWSTNYTVPAGTGLWKHNFVKDIGILDGWVATTVPVLNQNPWKEDDTFMGVAVPDFP